MQEIVPHVFTFTNLRAGRVYLLTEGDGLTLIVPRKMRLPPRFLTYDMAENIRSVARIVSLEPEVICFGHGRPVTQNAAQSLRDFARKVGAI